MMDSVHTSPRRSSPARRWRLAAALGLAVSLTALSAHANDDATAPVGADSGRVAEFLKNAQKALDRGDMRVALIELKNAARVSPADTDVRIKLGQLELRMGDGNAAERDLRQAAADGADKKAYLPSLLAAMLSQEHGADLLTEFPDPGANSTDPSAPDILRGRAEAFDHAGKPQDAKAAMDRALGLRRDTANLLAAATLDSRQQNGAEGEKLVDEVLAQDPSNLRAILLKLEMRRAAGDHDAELKLADKAVEIDAHGVRGKLARIAVYYDRKDDAKALEDINAVLAASPKLPLALYFKALIQVRAKDPKGAWAIAQALPPDFVSSQPTTTLGVAMIAVQSGNLESAGSLLSGLISREPSLAPPRVMLAAIRLQQNNPQSALDMLAPLKDGNSPQALALLAQASMRLHQYDKAETYFERASAAAPGSELLKTEMAMSELQSGKDDEGVEHLRELMNQDPKRPEAAGLLIATLLRESKYDDALAVVDKMDVKGALPWLYRGQIKAARGDLPGAIEAYRSAIKEDGTFTPARFALAQTLSQQGNIAEARQELDKLLEADPKSVRALLAEAEMTARDDKPDETIALLRKAIAAAPDDTQAPLALANYQIILGRPQDAQKTVEDLLKSNPDLPGALDLLGRLQAAAGDKANSINTFRKLIAKLPQSAPAQFRLAGAQAAAGDKSAAIASLQQALTLDPNFVAAREALIRFRIADGDNDGAIQLAREYQTLNPVRGGDILLAATLVSAKRNDEAAKLLEDSFAKRPDADKLMALAELDVRAKHPEKAQARMADWLKTHPDDLVVSRNYAGLLLQANDEKGAMAQYEQILKHNGYDAVSLNNLGELLQKQDPQRALSLITLAAKIAPRSANIIDSLGWMKYEGGEKDTGLILLTRAHALAADNSEITYHLVVAMDAAGKRDDAKKLLEPLVASNAAFSDRDAAKKLLDSWR
ncbi:MAG TPA: XrtA/PEP-CTERM system TPR-repeat protein PrsT [Aliidongia sp.]|nr:XrtA/PEP-CTERM system TPR-repeat protein PrsT [Aliidongia sp.]